MSPDPIALDPADGQPAIRYGVLPLHEVASVSGLDFLRGMIAGIYPAPPIAEISGMRLGRADEGEVEFEGAPTHAFMNPLGTIHGGWTSIMLDTVMACAVHTMLKAGQGYTTAEFKVHFVRPVFPSSAPVRAVGSVIHAGGRLATSEGKLYDARGRLLAHGTETCFVFDVPKAAAAA
ncbi:thioesterase [Alsobacter metallidurans]|uniref:Thioesterase n=1 Tax=Alsobacter metallidurans TaxID=340221 RepID=A0A917MGW2_9HYPH|nr:PaaI family thioesterase [Alsobacter metallidurans]GGH17555.1 thioesterase [Alsobacter metallidurans]